MKLQEITRARKLRTQGLSLREIAARTKYAKSSISGWIRDIVLTNKQISRLKSNQDKGRAKAANHPNSSRLRWAGIRQGIINSAKKEISLTHSLKTLKLIGAALYWAEGYTASRNLFVFANCNARMIQLMMHFLKRVCKVPIEKIKGRVNIHPSLDLKAADKYWSIVSGIPISKLYKPLLAVSKASKQKRKTLPYGTFRITICDVILCSKIKGWIEGLSSLGG
jgi:transcriptional regulator with XRE-family HTH domain